MTIKDFAENHKLKIGRDSCDEVIIAGKQGQIFEYSDTEMGVLFMSGLEKRKGFPEGRGIGRWCPKKWGNIKRAALPLGMALRQNGDSEGSLSFDPNNKAQVRMAIKIAGARPKRQVSPERAAVLIETLAKARSA